MTEHIRGCGWRKHGGLYLVGGFTPVWCDRIPYSLKFCPVCGGGIKVGRGFAKINPHHLFDNHKDCQENRDQCIMCNPPDAVAYIMRVGREYTPESFMEEGIRLGFSKRIHQIPRELKLGETIVYLAHSDACTEVDTTPDKPKKRKPKKEQLKLVEVEKVKKCLGIFTAFVPQRIEKIYWESEIEKMTDEEKKELEKRHITPIGVPYDKKHM